jgi:uncharacterized protein HemX
MEWLLQHGTQELGAFMNAPVLCVAFLILGIVLARWFFKGQMEGLREQTRACEQRLSLAREQEQAATKKASETKDAIQFLSKQFANNAQPIEIAATVASVGVSVDELMRAQWRVSQTIQTSSGAGGAIIRTDDL